MPDRQDRQHVRFIDIFKRKELLRKKFFRECIKKTNQFSAQYILEKMLYTHALHLSELKEEVDLLGKEEISRDLYFPNEVHLSFEKLCAEYDLSTLTIAEAAKVAIRLEERDLDFFKDLTDSFFAEDSKKALKRIISRKTRFIERLKKEQARYLPET
jgi:hypothetical protein